MGRGVRQYLNVVCSCGTEKALVSLEDGSLVETVVIPSETRTTGNYPAMLM